MADTFTFIPAKGFSKTPTIAIRHIAFGDGYSQRSPKGINNVTYTWTLRFVNRTLTESNAIEAFLLDKGGVFHFLWTPPDEVIEYKVVSQRWSSQITSQFSKTITATFVQVFDP
jgi:phage-related protein